MSHLPGIATQNGPIVRIKTACLVIDELLDADIQLRPAGREFPLGLCPFHDDHSPSLWVYPHRSLWGCNGSGCSAADTHNGINFRARWRRIPIRAAK